MPPGHSADIEGDSWKEWRIAILREMEKMDHRMASVESKIDDLRMKDATRKGALAAIASIAGFVSGWVGSFVKLK